ncbi:MAG: class I SAM-dependent methyltransferase [Promethearchaeota archaeon]
MTAKRQEPIRDSRESISHLSQKKSFYDHHQNFANRTLVDYHISPGTTAKYSLIKEHLGKQPFHSALDVGCSGNSFIHFLDNVRHRTFLDLAHRPLRYYSAYPKHHPTMGSITSMPFSNHSFDLITALDVIEHIKDDHAAAIELTRVLAPKGILVVTVPHRMKFYTNQDRLIGHYRRYEIPEVQALFESMGLRRLMTFGVYGQAMRVQFVQESNPEKMDQDMVQLRSRYQTNATFRRIWDKIVAIGAFFMKLDATFQPQRNLMNICMIFRKQDT